MNYEQAIKASFLVFLFGAGLALLGGLLKGQAVLLNLLPIPFMVEVALQITAGFADQMIFVSGVFCTIGYITFVGTAIWYIKAYRRFPGQAVSTILKEGKAQILSQQKGGYLL